MKALVVGGAGFVGSTLVDRLLAEGHAVDVVDDLSTGSLANLAEARADRSHDFTFHRLDVTEPVLADLVARRRPRVIYHLALPSPGGGDVVAAARGIVLGTQQVLAAAGANGVAKVVVGLDARLHYGPVEPAELPVAESFAGRDRGPCGDAVRVVIASLETARTDAALEFTAVALGSVYGPRQPTASPIARLVAAAVAAGGSAVGEALAVAAGTGWADSTDDLVFVDDAVDALVRAAGRGSGLVINVGTGVATSGRALAEAVAAAVAAIPSIEADPSPVVAFEPPLAPTVTHFALDAARAGMQLGWKPWTTVVDGVVTTVGDGAGTM